LTEKPIIVFGPPRSGTTWLASVISQGIYSSVHEPDNGKNNGLACILQNSLPRFPYLKENEISKNYNQLWKLVFNGQYFGGGSYRNQLLTKLTNTGKIKVEEQLTNSGIYSVSREAWARSVADGLLVLSKKQTRPDIIKSVHSFLSIPYLKKHFDFIPLIILRNPAAVISSMIGMNMPDIQRNVFENPSIVRDFLAPYKDQIDKLNNKFELYGLQVGIFHFILNEYIKKYNYHVVLHEDIVQNPLERFSELFDNLGIKAETDLQELLSKKNKKGKGYELNRDLNTVNEKWKMDLSDNQIASIKKAYNLFPNQPYNNSL